MSDNMNRTSNLEAFLKGSTILIVSNICLKAINFFLLPLYTSYLTPGMLGVSDTVTTFIGFLLPLLTMGLDSAYSAFYFVKEDPERGKRVFSTLSLAFLLLGLVPLLGFPAAAPLSQLLFQTREYALVVKFALASISFNLWYLPFSLELRLQNRMAAFGLVNVVSSLLMILLNVLFVTFLHLGEMSLVLSTMAVHGVQIFLYAAFVRRLPKWQETDSVLFGNMMRFAFPLIPMTLMNWVLTLSDRAVILYFLGDSYVGLYGIGTRFTTMANVVISAVSTAYTTFAFSNVENQDAKKQYYYVFNVVSLMLLFFALSVSLFSKEIIGIMTHSETYLDSYQALRDLMFAQSLYGMSTLVGYGIYFKKKTQYSLAAVSAAAVVNLILNIVFIPKYGYAVAATTTLIGYLIQLVIIYAASEKLYPCDYGMKAIAPLTAVLWLINVILQESTLLLRCGVWAVCVAVTIVLFRRILGFMLQFVVSVIARKH